jgi:PAS domain S-box-containing protein
MKHKFLSIVILFATTLVGILVFTIGTLVEQKKDAAIIDLTGRQRMLNHRHLSEILAVSQGSSAHYGYTREVFNQTIEALTTGGQLIENLETGETLPVAPFLNEQMGKQLQAQKLLMKEFSSKADQFLQLSKSHSSDPAKIQELIILNNALHDAIDDLVKLVRHRSENRMAMMIRWEVGIGLIVLLFGFFLTRQVIEANRKRDSEIEERKRAEQRLALQYAVARTLSEHQQDVEIALSKVLESIGRNLQWAVSSYWEVNAASDVLHCKKYWSRPGNNLDDFQEVTRGLTFSKGTGLPGRVWKTGAPVSIFDVVIDTKFPRAPFATQSGLHGAFGFPVLSGGETIGVIEVFSTVPEKLNDDLLQLFLILGKQIGQFIQTKRVEEEMAISNSRLAGILACAHDGVISVDDTQCIQFFNQGAEEIFGYPAKEVLGQPLALLLLQYEIDTHYSHVLALAKDQDEVRGTRGVRKVYGRRKDGNVFPAEVSISKITQKEQATFTVILRDITQRQEAEVALQKAYTFTGELLASISSILISVNEDGMIGQWNKEAEKTFGLLATKVQGQLFRLCGIQWNWSIVSEGLCRCLETHQTIRLDDLRYTNLSEKEGFLSLTLTPIKGESTDKANGILILGADISERKLLESQLVLAQKMESIGQLAAGIAHEINTPAQFVSDNLRFLQDSFSSIQTLLTTYEQLVQTLATSPFDLQLLHRTKSAFAETDLEFMKEEIPKALNQSLDGTNRISKIVRAMKDFSHPGAEGKKPIDLNRAIESTTTVARNEWKYVANVITDLDSTMPLVPCLPGEINQVILNLVINAAHAIGDAIGPEVGQKGTITISTRKEGEWMEMRIADTGTGIPEAARTKIFDPFFTTKEVGKGTGQGLAIAHDVIVNKHGGTLTYETTPGKGTTFMIRLPLEGIPVCKEAS